MFICLISFNGRSKCFRDTHFIIFLIFLFVFYLNSVRYYFDIFYILIFYFLNHYHIMILSQ